MNGSDACFVGLADSLLASTEKDTLLNTLVEYTWKKIDSESLASSVSHIIDTMKTPEELPNGNVEPNMALINDLCSADNVTDVVHAILNADMSENKWLQRAQSTLAKGSPITMHLVFEQ